MKSLFSIHSFAILFCLSILCNCRQNPAEVTPRKINIPRFETTGFPVPNDSISAPFETIAGQPDRVEFTQRASFPASDNIRPAGVPRVERANNHKTKRASGTIVKPVIKIVPCTQKEPIPAQKPRFKDEASCNIQYLDVDQGISSSYVYKIYQDREGNLWFSTSAALTKYDGITFTNFTEKEGLLKGSVRSILQDREGKMWFGTTQGFCKYDGKVFTHYTQEDGPLKLAVRSIIEDKEGDLWLGTSKGVYCYKNGLLKTYSENDGLISNSVASLLMDKSGILWCATDKGISKFDGSTFISYGKEEGFASALSHSIAQDKNGNIWFATEAGLIKYTGGAFIHYTDKEGLVNNVARNVLVDKENNIWVTAFRGGMSKFNGKTFTHFTENEGLSINTIWTMMEDRIGNIWVGTDGGGICKYSSNSFRHFTSKQGMNSIVINIYEDSRGHLWLGTYGDGLCKYDGKTFTYYKDPGLFTGTVWAITEDSKGNIWFGGVTSGVLKYNGKYLEHYTTSQGLSSNNIASIYEDKNGDIWFGAEKGGATRFNGKMFVRYSTEQGLCSDNVKSVLQAKDGSMWLGTVKGLNHIKNGAVYRFTEKEGLGNNNIKNMLEDKDGNIWIGTLGGGLNKYDGKFLSKYTETEGLSNNYIRSIVEDEPGNHGIWVSTDNGIDHLLADSSQSLNTNPAYRIFVYKRDDGLKGEDFCSNSGFRDSHNRIWWGSVKSLTMLDVTTIRAESPTPKIQLHTIYLEQNFADFKNLHDSIKAGKKWLVGENKNTDLSRIKFSGVPDFYNYPLNLELPYTINNISFSFGAIDWSSPHKINYQYILEGSDKDWHPVTSETKAIYTNLPGGKYVFKVKAKGFSGNWSQPFEYSFTVHPPWWQTIWAYLFYFIIIAAAFFIYTSWRTKALLKRQKELEKTVIERTADVIEEKNKVQEKNGIIEKKQTEILDSINYAKRIQYSLLANEELLNKCLPQHFVFFKPKDIVSGDFYWATAISRQNTVGSQHELQTADNLLFYLSVCDSTGHGVPGAFVSLLNISFLNEAINEKNIREPNKVLDFVRERLIKSMDGQDGMDATLMAFSEKSVTYASAHNKPILIRDGKITELNADKMPVGKGIKTDPFSLYSFEAMKGDCIYLYTDGFADQFGGPKGKKFKYKALNELLLSYHHLPMNAQKQLLEKAFTSWKGELEQVDDVCIIGISL